MKFLPTELPGVVRIELEPHRDGRGEFARTFCAEAFEAAGLRGRFVQHNRSTNLRSGTLRGLHYQAAPYAEAKVVRCVRGALYDVVVDLRPTSPTYLRWLATELREELPLMLYVPEGFAHGFQTLRDDTELHYLMSAPYRPEAARGLRWDDPAFAIAWPDTPHRLLSERDATFPSFDGSPASAAGPPLCPLCAAPTRSLARLADSPPLQNLLHERREEALAIERRDVELFYCEACCFAFDPAFAPPDAAHLERYDNGQLASPRYRAYLEGLAEELISALPKALPEDRPARILEVACGDGALLGLLHRRGVAALEGWDPCYRGAHGVEAFVRRAPFEAASEAPAELVILRHALEALADPDRVLAAMAASLAPEGWLYLELTDLDALLREGDASRLSREYARVHSLTSIARYLARFGLAPARVERRFGEAYLGLWARRRPSLEGLGEGLERIEAMLAEHRSVAIWGAAGRAISALTQRGWDERRVHFAVDADPRKQGKHLPVTGQRVLSPEEARARRPDLVIVANAVYLEEIRASIGPEARLVTMDGVTMDGVAMDGQLHG